MAIQIIKLSNGETIITDVVNATERVLTVINPLEIGRDSISHLSNRMNIIAYAWIPMEEGKDENVMYIHKQHVVGLSNATTEMKEYYNEAVGIIVHGSEVAREEEEYESYAIGHANTTTTSFH